MQVEDFMKLPNVAMTPKVKNGMSPSISYGYEITPAIQELMFKLVPMYPQWQFRISDGNLRYDRNNQPYLRIDEFTVFHENEEIGVISKAYYRRDWVITISCRRARAQLKRGDTIRTKDTAKALSAIKKLFAKRSTSERLNDACLKTEHFMGQAGWQISQKVKAEYDKFSAAMMEFIHTEGNERFKKFIEDRPQWTPAMNALLKYEELRGEEEVVSKVSKSYRAGKTCITMLDDGKYVVQRKLEPAVSFTDTTLPEYLRGKIGLLKLINDGQIVGGVGCRISESVFVIVDEEGDSNA